MLLHITSTTKSVRKRPTTRDELMSIIKDEVNRQGLDADLNFIDTSLITDMACLFINCPDVRNIKIDQWNVSNVTNMECCNFNCDLSSWDTSNVVNMDYMFGGCMNLDTDLSSWNVSNVISHRKFADFCTTQFYNNMPNFS